MPVFKDSAGREWQIKLDGPKIREVRQALQINLGAIDPEIFNRLETDPVLLGDLLWVLCRGQNDGVTDRAFGESLVGDPIEHATKALYDAWCDFFPERKRSLLRSLAAQQAALESKGIAQAMEQLTDPALEAKFLAAAKTKTEREIQTLLTSLNGASSSPESAESAPTA